MQKNTRNRRRNRRRPRQNPRNMLKNIIEAKSQKISPYMEMLVNPCGAHLQPGIHGDTEGLMARVKESYTFTGAQTCGYFVWDPTYCSSRNGHNGANVFAWKHTDSSFQPNNDNLDSYGIQSFTSVADFVTASGVPDPAHTFVDSDIVEDARHVSSCLALTYFGAQLVASGQLGILENVPASVLLTGGQGGFPASVDELFRYTSTTTRLGTDTLEVLPRPVDGTELFRNPDQFPIAIPPDANPSVISQTGQTIPPTMSGFVWRGIESKTDLVIEAVKNLEWRASPLSGLALTHPHTSGRSQVAVAHAKLDRERPGWASRVRNIGPVKLPTSSLPLLEPRPKTDFWGSLISGGQQAVTAVNTANSLRNALDTLLPATEEEQLLITMLGGL